MTRALPFTQAGLRRALAAARKEGFQSVRLLPDGSMIMENKTGIVPEAGEGQACTVPKSKWDDVEA
jgi:hypothetical protein